jgi:hypothetical protein
MKPNKSNKMATTKGKGNKTPVLASSATPPSITLAGIREGDFDKVSIDINWNGLESYIVSVCHFKDGTTSGETGDLIWEHRYDPYGWPPLQTHYDAPPLQINPSVPHSYMANVYAKDANGVALQASARLTLS